MRTLERHPPHNGPEPSRVIMYRRREGFPVSVAEQAQVGVIQEEEAALPGFSTHWSLSKCPDWSIIHKHLYLDQREPLPIPVVSEALVLVNHAHPIRTSATPHTFAQSFLCPPVILWSPS